MYYLSIQYMQYRLGYLLVLLTLVRPLVVHERHDIRLYGQIPLPPRPVICQHQAPSGHILSLWPGFEPLEADLSPCRARPSSGLL